MRLFSYVLLQSPQPMSYDKYLEHIDTTMGADTPIAFGLHPNAEIDFRTQQSDTMFKVQRQMNRCRLVGVIRFNASTLQRKMRYFRGETVLAGENERMEASKNDDQRLRAPTCSKSNSRTGF